MISIDFYHWFNGAPNQRADNFGVWLFALIAKADMMNRAKLRCIFPVEVEVFERFMKEESYPISILTCQMIAAKLKEWGIEDVA